jgi:lysophospholipase L1-like esterase
MDTLRLIVKSMKTIERKDFRQFIQNQRKLSKRIDLKLFDLLTNHSADKDMENSLYGKPNKAAYHAVRKRLTRKLTDFIVLKRIEEDTTSSQFPDGHDIACKVLF